MEKEYLAKHLMIEIINSSYLNDAELMKDFLTNTAHLFGSEILVLKVHQFHPHGLSALMIMHESHIAVHTWPEYQFASMDIFLKASSEPSQSLPLIKKYFHPEDVKIVEIERGIN